MKHIVFILLFLIPLVVIADEDLVLEKISNLALAQTNTQEMITDFVKSQKAIDDAQSVCITNNEKALIAISKDVNMLDWIIKVIFGIPIGAGGTVLIGKAKNGKSKII